jgi:hypothetical protein
MKKIHVISFIAILLSTSLFVVSCKKDEEAPADEHTHSATATITITNPVEGTTYEAGDVVPVDVSISGSAELHGYQVLLINTTADDTLINAEVHDHATTYTYTNTWTNDVSAHSDMICKVKAIVDHDGNATEKSVAFHCHPM